MADMLNQTSKAETRPLFVEEWVAGLPYAHPEAVGRELLAKLSLLNREPLKAGARKDLLELYIKPYRYLLDSRDIIHANLSVAAFERNRAAVEMIRKVAVEIGFGYKLALRDSMPGPGSKPGKLLGPLLQRTVGFLAQVLMHSYHEYLPTPRNVWKELHELFVLARNYHLTEAALANQAAPEDMLDSLEDIYKRILLTGLADPYHLSYGEVWEVYQTIDGWTREVRISSNPPAGNRPGFFVIDPNVDARPQAFLLAPEAHSPVSLYLDANILMQRVQERISELHRFTNATYEQSSGALKRSSIALLRRMARNWGLPPKRHGPRVLGRGQLHLVSGISALHYFLSGETLAPMASAQCEQPGTGGIEVDGYTEETKAAYAREEWKLINEGPNGIGILRPRRPEHLIRVGEAVGIQMAGQVEPRTGWVVGVVRWLVVRQTGEYLAGVQLLGQGPIGVTVQAETRPQGPRAALLFPDSRDGRQATVIAPSGTYMDKQDIVVETAQGTMTGRAETLLEANTGFDYFRFRL